VLFIFKILLSKTKDLNSIKMMWNHTKPETLPPIIRCVRCLCENIILYRYQETLIVLDSVLFSNNILKDTKKFWLNKRKKKRKIGNRIGSVMVSMLALSTIYCGFEPWSGQTKEYKIGICCFSAKHAALRSKSKDWLAWNQNKVSKWSGISTCRLLFQWASTIKVQLSVLV
jgi:hypothetical protein